MYFLIKHLIETRLVQIVELLDLILTLSIFLCIFLYILCIFSCIVYLLCIYKNENMNNNIIYI